LFRNFLTQLNTMIFDLDTIAHTHALYTLDKERRYAVKRCADPLEWLDWMQSNSSEIDRTVLLNNREIVTLFAGYAGERHESRPYVFCSMMKPEPQLPDFAVVLNWYASLDEAREGHNKLVNSYARINKIDSDYNAMMRKRSRKN
jgi:hypothetical protein